MSWKLVRQATVATTLFAVTAHAEDAPATRASSIELNAQIEGGIVANPDSPKDNFGQLFTDKANQLQLNQILLTVGRTIDPKETGWDVGFKLQALYGSDARYTHFLGELDRVTADRDQLDITEASITVHAPLLSEGGIDFKLGQYPTPIGYETIDPSTNPFYSHSYIFNFGLPLKHTGGYATIHATDVIDIWAGGDTGVNTSLGGGDNNSAPAALFGFGLNLLGGDLTVLTLSNVGPENPSRVVPNANSYNRYINDAVITYKATAKLTFTTETNYIRDDYYRAEGYGAAQYASYALPNSITLNARGEIYRDSKGFYVAAFPGNLDFVDAEIGRPTTVIGAPPTTYGAVTIGATFKPPMPSPVATLMLRPELRYDRSLNGTAPFNGGREKGAFTLAADVVIGF